MSHDPIVKEVRKYRDAYAKRFNYDLQAISHDLQVQQEKSGRKRLSLPPKPVKSIVAVQD
jgi:hypothetical protein